MTIKLYPCSLVINQTKDDCVGTQIKDMEQYASLLAEKISPDDDFGDKGVLILDTDDEHMLSLLGSGSAPRSMMTEENRIAKEYRGEMSVFLDRNKVNVPQPKKSINIIYNMEAVKADLDCKDDVQVMIDGGFTHMWVTTRAEVAETSETSPYRLAVNMQGGSHLYDEVNTELKARAVIFQSGMNKNSATFYPDVTKSSAYRFCSHLMKRKDTDIDIANGYGGSRTLRQIAEAVRDHYVNWVTVAG